MSVDIGILERWIDGFSRSERPIRRIYLSRQCADTLQFAEDLGVLRAAGLAAEVGCEVCVEPHICPVTRDSEGQYGYRCLINGSIDVSAEDLRLLVIDRDALLNRIAIAADVLHKPTAAFANGHLTGIGLVTSDPNRPWYLGFAEKLQDENVLAGVIEALTNRFPKGPGLIASASSIAINTPLPKNYRLIPLRDLMIASVAGLVINRGAIRDRLGQAKPAPGRPGRHSKGMITHRLLMDLSSRGDWPNRLSDQAKRIRRDWPAEEGTPPALGTIENQLALLRRKKR